MPLEVGRTIELGVTIRRIVGWIESATPSASSSPGAASIEIRSRRKMSEREPPATTPTSTVPRDGPSGSVPGGSTTSAL